jgi:uncharacterized membrane protein YfcA
MKFLTVLGALLIMLGAFVLIQGDDSSLVIIPVGLFFFICGMRLSKRKSTTHVEKIRVTEREKHPGSFMRFLQVCAAIATIIGAVIAVMSLMGNK